MNLDLARMQFAFTSVSHFFFVAVTIGLGVVTGLVEEQPASSRSSLTSVRG